MPRILPIDDTKLSEGSRTLLDPIRRKLGRTPNIYATFAHSPAALEYLLGGNRALAKMTLPGALREAVALAVAGITGCDYCAAAHTLMARQAGASAEEATANLCGESTDPRTQAAIDFASAVVAGEGHVNDSDLDAARAAGFADAQIAELIVVVAHNLLTNYFNHVASSDIDFPPVAMPAQAAAR
jgi:uncharacterized peroxidase-related enzyme